MESYNRDMDIHMMLYSPSALIESDYSGLLGVESATAYWGLSTFSPDISILLLNDDSLSDEGYECESSLCFLAVPKVNDTNVIKLSPHFCVTDREQTICDMIRYKRHEFHLYETILSAYDDNEVDIERLESLAKNYNILDRLKSLYVEACEIYDIEEG